MSMRCTNSRRKFVFDFIVLHYAALGNYFL